MGVQALARELEGIISGLKMGGDRQAWAGVDLA